MADVFDPLVSGQQIMDDSLAVTIASDQTAIPVDIGLPVGPVVVTATATDVAKKGGTANINSPEAEGKKLSKILVWASQSFKADIRTVDNAVESPSKGLGGQLEFTTFEFHPPHKNYITLGTSAGADNFRVKVTNLGNKDADAVVTFFYES